MAATKKVKFKDMCTVVDSRDPPPEHNVSYVQYMFYDDCDPFEQYEDKILNLKHTVDDLKSGAFCFDQMRYFMNKGLSFDAHISFNNPDVNKPRRFCTIIDRNAIKEDD